MYRIAIEALGLARTQGLGSLLERATSPNVWWRLIYGGLQIRDWRSILAREYLVGQGLEIGALHKPLKVRNGAQVTYVDRLDLPGLRAHHPELQRFDLVNVDIEAVPGRTSRGDRGSSQ